MMKTLKNVGDTNKKKTTIFPYDNNFEEINNGSH